jgi:uncharacterized hydrophobic protein (TIGR00271 family)
MRRPLPTLQTIRPIRLHRQRRPPLQNRLGPRRPQRLPNDPSRPYSIHFERSLRMNPAQGAWYRDWWFAIREINDVDTARRETVLREIDAGSQPSPVYYILLGISALISGFALIIDSDATLVGASVVAPLMTPIIGMSLGLLRGDLRLLGMAMKAEFGGALFGVVLCFGLGSLPIVGDPGAALLAQTRPTLIDLFIAALAGFAGVLAMIDERISPALPGVAIATALNPPIAAIGLCLASGAYAGAWGAFLLFLANVLAILVVGAAVFFAAGFVSREEVGSLREVLRRFAATLVCLVLVGVLLTAHLINLVTDVRSERAIRTVVAAQLAEEPNATLVDVEFVRRDEHVDVIASVDAPRVIAPDRVQQMEALLEDRLGRDVRLFVRSNLTKDVTATGSTNILPTLSLDGKVAEAPLSPTMRMLHEAEQVTREVMAALPYMRFEDIQVVELASRPVLLVSVQSPRQISAAQVRRFQDRLRERLGIADLRVDVRRTNTSDMTAKGPVLLGEAHFGIATAEEEAARTDAETLLRTALERRPDFFVLGLDAVRGATGWEARAEVVGPRLLTPAEIRDIEQRVAGELDAPVTLAVWARTELQVRSDGYQAIGTRVQSR